jgi:hypothetical protein
MKRIKRFPGGILGIYTAIIMIGALYPLAAVSRSVPGLWTPMILTTLYFLVTGALIWAGRSIASRLFLAGMIFLIIWTGWRIYELGFTPMRLAMLVAWVMALPGYVVIRDEMEKLALATLKSD